MAHRKGKKPGSTSSTGERKRRNSRARVVRLPENRLTPRSGAGTPSTGAAATRSVGHVRVRLVVAAVAVVGLLLGGRAAQLSLAESERSQVLAFEERAQTAPAPAQGRGDILSADGRKLATSLEIARVVATPYQIENPEETARELVGVLGPATGQSSSQITDALTERDQYGDLAGYSVVASVKPEVGEKVRKLGLEGVGVTPTTVRVYPDRSLASQLTGHLGDYDEAFGGVEARYDETLRSGEHVELTLDTAVQNELEDALESAVKKHDAKSALGLIVRVEDGAVVALANSPGYDNNRFGQVPAETQRDRVLTDPYEPGSTFKPFTVAAALEEGAIDQSSVFTVPDSVKVADRIIHDSVPHETRIMRPQEVLAQSSNVGVIQIAQVLGGQNLHEYIRGFGFGEATGVDLWGEDPGYVPSYEDWSGSSIGTIPMGQGLTVTPLQLAASYAALANGGHKITPHVTQRDVKTPGPKVISAETSAIVRGMLQSVVDEGTGRFARIPGYTVAGKTGTSQKVDPETGTYGDRYVASFVGFAPASDPKYLALVVVDEPKTVIWGERVAAPAFREVMGFTLSYFNVAPDRAAEAREAP
jgi:cell division protein FtsI (penicillin-binding protein 3)